MSSITYFKRNAKGACFLNEGTNRCEMQRKVKRGPTALMGKGPKDDLH